MVKQVVKAACPSGGAGIGLCQGSDLPGSESRSRSGEEAAVTQRQEKRTTRTESSWRCVSVEAPSMMDVEVRLMQKETGFKGVKAVWRLQRGLAAAEDMWPGCPFKDVGSTAEDKVPQMTQERKKQSWGESEL